MYILPEHALDITGFAGVRERVYVMSSQQFNRSGHEDASEGLGPYVYLADAHIRPGGSTKMHAHNNIDIITVMLRGELTHQGSLGHGTVLRHGSAQIQYSGQSGFSHNELNTSDAFNRFIQIWVQPDAATPNHEARYHDITFNSNNTTRLHTHAATGWHLDFITLDTAEGVTFTNNVLLFLIDGDMLVSEGEHREHINETGLLQSTTKNSSTTIKCQKPSRFIAIHSEANLFIHDTK